jgi:hypothetical protein
MQEAPAVRLAQLLKEILVDPYMSNFTIPTRYPVSLAQSTLRHIYSLKYTSHSLFTFACGGHARAGEDHLAVDAFPTSKIQGGYRRLGWTMTLALTIFDGNEKTRSGTKRLQLHFLAAF